VSDRLRTGPDNQRYMHLIVPFASVQSPAGRQAMQTLVLPGLSNWLRGSVACPFDSVDESSFSPPHERALARELGWACGPDNDGRLPFAAWHAVQAGVVEADASVGRLTPVHLEVGTDLLVMAEPGLLALDDPASRELLELIRPVFEDHGFQVHYQSPLVWWLVHPLLAVERCASLDRVIGRAIEPWTGAHPRLLRRLLLEAQMVLHQHPANEAREDRGQQAVNSVWLSDCGPLPATRNAAPSPAPPRVDDRLRAPALAQDWLAWVEAWRELDAELARADRPGATLTLAGDIAAQSFERPPATLWQRLASNWRGQDIHTVLGAL
jgi:hypothetical protein